MILTRKAYTLGKDQYAISYEIHDDNGHTVQLTEAEAHLLLKNLHLMLNVSAQNTIQVQDLEREAREMEVEPAVIEGCYPSEAAFNTHHIWGGGHDDNTHEFSFFMDNDAIEEEKDGVIRYIFPDVVLVRHDGILETEKEMK